MVNGINNMINDDIIDITGISFIPLGRFVYHMNLNGLIYDPNRADSSLSSGHIFMIMNDYLNGKINISEDYVVVYMNNVCEATRAEIPDVGKLFINGKFFGLIGPGVPPMQELYTCGKLGKRSGFFVNPEMVKSNQSTDGGVREISNTQFPDPFAIDFNGR